MQFNFSFNASVSSAPSAFKAAVIAAGQQLASYFSNAITINISVGWGENGGTTIDSSQAEATGGPLNGTFLSYAQVVSNLAKTAQSGDDQTSVSFLQGIADPTHGGRFFVGGAQGKAFGLTSLTSSAIDGQVGFATGIPWDFNPNDGISAGLEDFNAVALHEITHAMGRTRGPEYAPGFWEPLDLFGFSSANSLQLVQGQSAYFSTNGGKNNLDPFDTVGDPGDWASSVNGDPFGYGSRGVLKPVTSVDLREMDVLGFTLSAATNTIAHTIDSTTAAAVVIGTANDDIINATGGNATITGGPGNDIVTGGGGVNTSVYTGTSKNYTVSVTAGATAFTVQDRVGTDGTDTLTNIQKLQFTDQTIDTTIFTKTASLSSAQVAELVDVYVAYFNRAPDAAGLDFWGGALKDGTGFTAIANGFAGSPEAVAAYPASLSNQAFVTAVYTNVLGRNTDASGLSFWSAQLQSGAVSKGGFILSVIESVLLQSGTADAQYIANKEAVGAHFALAQGLSDGTWAKTVMAAVTGSAASVAAANAQTDSFAATAATTAGAEFVVKIMGIVA